MARDWARLCKGAGLTVEGDEVEVRFPDERRHHRVRIEDADDALRLVGVVARGGAVKTLDDLVLRLWSLNRTTQLVGFRIDERERIIGEAWVPKVGLGASELVFCVRQVAAACDRLEYLLTGKDKE